MKIMSTILLDNAPEGNHPMLLAVVILVAIAAAAIRASYKSTDDKEHRVRVTGVTSWLMIVIYYGLGAMSHGEIQRALFAAGSIVIVVGVGIYLRMLNRLNAETQRPSRHAAQ